MKQPNPLAQRIASQVKLKVEDRNRALRILDMEWARETMPDAADDFVRLSAMHKARVEVITIDRALRRESMDWLKSRGMFRAGRLPWPSNGDLPD